MIADPLNYSVRDDLSVFNDHIESLYIEIEKYVLGTDKNIIVGTYRPHKDPDVFHEKTHTHISTKL